MPLLDVENLTVSFDSFPVVNSISFSLEKKKCLCLVGESGCGKSMTSLALMGLLPEGAKLSADKILFENEDLLTLSTKEMAKIRGNKLAMIFQDPMSALNPVLPLGEQVAEPLRIHKKYSKKQALEEAIRLLTEVGIKNAQERIKDYAHQFSGGMLQRVMIATMLACKPSLLIADEPTTALDVASQEQIIKLIQSLMKSYDMGLLFITHDMDRAKELADSIAVMYAGKIVEYSPVEEFFEKPLHPYAKGLLASLPTEENQKLERLPTIKGTVPSPFEIIEGCRFKNRCPYADSECDKEPPMQEINGRKVLCKLTF